MFALPDMFHFLADKFARLGGGRPPFAFVFACPFNHFFFWHDKVSPLERYSDVTERANAL
jgi:hypothetical protein